MSRIQTTSAERLAERLATLLDLQQKTTLTLAELLKDMTGGETNEPVAEPEETSPQDEGEHSCYICLESEGDMVESDCRCKVRLHAECLANHLQHSSRCGICRGRMIDDNPAPAHEELARRTAERDAERARRDAEYRVACERYYQNTFGINNRDDYYEMVNRYNIIDRINETNKYIMLSCPPEILALAPDAETIGDFVVEVIGHKREFLEALIDRFNWRMRSRIENVVVCAHRNNYPEDYELESPEQIFCNMFSNSIENSVIIMGTRGVKFIDFSKLYKNIPLITQFIKRGLIVDASQYHTLIEGVNNNLRRHLFDIEQYDVQERTALRKIKQSIRAYDKYEAEINDPKPFGIIPSRIPSTCEKVLYYLRVAILNRIAKHQGIHSYARGTQMNIPEDFIIGVSLFDDVRLRSRASRSATQANLTSLYNPSWGAKPHRLMFKIPEDLGANIGGTNLMEVFKVVPAVGV